MAFGILVPLAEAHQRLVRPRVLVEDRDLDDAGADHRLGLRGRALDRLDLAQHVVGPDDVRVELDLERGVGRADLGDALDLAVADRVGHRQALEESLQRHALVAFDEQMLVATERIAVLHQATSLALLGGAANFVSSHFSRKRVSKRPATTSGSAASAACSGTVVGMPATVSPASALRSRSRHSARSAPVHDELAEQRVVEGRHGVALEQHRVEAHALALRDDQTADQARTRHEVAMRVLRVDAALDRVAGDA